jgi:hypothetical protein
MKKLMELNGMIKMKNTESLIIKTEASPFRKLNSRYNLNSVRVGDIRQRNWQCYLLPRT